MKKNILLIIFIFTLTACSLNTEKVFEYKNLDGQILQVINYYNKENEPNNYLMAIKLSNQTEEKIDIGNLTTSMVLKNENVEIAKGSVKLENPLEERQVVLPHEDKIVLIEFKFDYGQGDNYHFGFTHQNTDYLFRHLVNQRRFDSNYQASDNTVYENQESKIYLSIEDLKNHSFMKYPEIYSRFSASTASATYTNKTNKYLFIPMLQNRGRIINNSNIKHQKSIVLEDFQVDHDFVAEDLGDQSFNENFILLEPKQEITMDVSSTFYSTGENYKKYLDDPISLELKYHVLDNYKNSIVNVVDDFMEGLHLGRHFSI